MKVTHLHRWPADQDSIERDLAAYDEAAVMREQVAENHQNAWLVVIEQDGPALEVDMGEFSYSPTSTANAGDAQAAWLEETLVDSPSRSVVAFYLHFVEPGGTLHYGDEHLTLPNATPMPADLLSRMPYESPD